MLDWIIDRIDPNLASVTITGSEQIVLSCTVR